MPSKATCLITSSQIEPVFKIVDAVRCVENAFRLYGEGKVQMPPKVYLTFETGDLRAMPVYLPTLGIAGLKSVTVHPQNRELPTVMATILLVDPQSGFPLAMMDGTYLTDLRTGAAGAVAAKYLARADSAVAGFVATGRQAQTQLDGLMVTMPGIRKVLAYDLNRDRAQSFCDRCEKTYGREARPVDSVEEVVRQSDIIVTTTPARGPVVQSAWVRPGAHINAIGADAKGKQELDPAILKRARVVVDNWEQASHSGEINVPVSQGLIRRGDLVGDIGDLVTGRKKGRVTPQDITVFDSTGLAVQDITCAFEVYQTLTGNEKARQGLRTIGFF